MPFRKKKCHSCEHLNHVRSTQCKVCNSLLQGGRPRNTKASDGYKVTHSGGRPVGTTSEAGYGVGRSGGRPTGSRGFGRPKGHSGVVSFLDNVGLPSEWDTSAINLSEELLQICESRIKQQRTFDRKSLGVGVCYRCGHVLWTSVDGTHTFLVDKPNNMTKEDAPASAYLRAVRNCSLSFEYAERGSSTKQRWYCCSHCKKATIPADLHVGHVFGKDVCNVLLVPEWEMNLPEPVTAL